MENRRYVDKEIRALIQRATELQEASDARFEHSLSLRELEEIAADLGVDPQHLRAAALELEHQGTPQPFSLLGAPFVIDHHLVAEGTVTDEAWEQIVLGLRRRTGHTGAPETLGPTRAWSYALEGLGQTRVTLSPHGEDTAIQVHQSYRGQAAVLYTVGFFFSATVAGVLLDGGGLPDVANLAIVGGSGLGALAATRAALAHWARRQHEKLGRLTSWLRTAIARPQTARAKVEPTLDPPVLTEEADEASRHPASTASRRPLRS